MKKFLCAVMALCMAFPLVSCGDADNTQQSGTQMVSDAGKDVNLNEEDMPYGATVIELSKNNDNYVKYVTCFDRRFFGNNNEENPDYSEIYAVHDYIAALNTNDHNALKSLYFDGYLDLICAESFDSSDEYIDTLNNTLVTFLGEGFEINYIDISACYNPGDTIADDYISTVDSYLENIGVLDKVTSRKVVEVGGYTCYSVNGANSYQLTNSMETIIIGLYTIDGKVYIV